MVVGTALGARKSASNFGLVTSPPTAISCSGPRLEPEITQISAELIQITASGAVLGYVEITNGVFVALAGERYDRAVEVAQALDLDRAVAAFAGDSLAA